MKKIASLLLAILSFTTYTKAQTDVTALAITPSSYQVPGTTDFGFTFKNLGSSGIASYKVYWQFENGPVQSVSKVAFDTKFDGAYGLVQDPSFKVTFPAPGTYQLKAWIQMTTPSDYDPTNDTIVVEYKVKDNLPKKYVLLEIFKHQACGPCYKAAKYVNDVVVKNQDYAVANIYTVPTDIVYCADGKTVNDQYGFAHPMPVFDRYKFPFRSKIGTGFSSTSSGVELRAYGEREKDYEPARAFIESVDYDVNTRLLKVRVGAQFYDNLSGDYRFNLYVTEDSIKGYQASAPDPNNYYHMNVVRAMLGGAWGKQGSLPATISNNDVKYYDFTYTIPASYKTDKLYLIAMVQTYNSDPLKRHVLNSQQKTFAQALTLSVNETLGQQPTIQVYPNPAQQHINISLKTTCDIRIMDMSGKVVYQQAQCNGLQQIEISAYPAGSYIIHADDGKVVHTKTFVKE